MSISYQSKDDKVLGVALKVQELCVKVGDPVLSGAGTPVVTIEVGEAVEEVRAAMHVDDSAGSILVIAAADRSVSGSQITLNLASALSSADAIIVKYVVAE